MLDDCRSTLFAPCTITFNTVAVTTSFKGLPWFLISLVNQINEVIMGSPCYCMVFRLLVQHWDPPLLIIGFVKTFVVFNCIEDFLFWLSGLEYRMILISLKSSIRDEYKEFEKLIQEDLQEVDDRLEEEEVMINISFLLYILS